MSNADDEIKNEISARIKFSDFTKILDGISSASTISKKSEILSKYFEAFNQFREEFLLQHGTKCVASIFPILRLLLPADDRERPAFGIKTYTMGKLIVRILAIDPNGDVAKRLMRKTPVDGGGGGGGSDGIGKHYGDYADTVYEVMKNRASTIGELTIYDVNRHLDRIAEFNQNNKRKQIEDELITLLNGMTAIDQKWLIRIILHQVRFGLGQKKILSVFHPSAPQLYATYTHLSKMCDCIENANAGDTDVRPLHHTVQPGHAFRSMLCARINSLGTLEQLIANAEYYLETKMDGERFQIHITEGQKYNYFSRKSHGYQNFGTDASNGTLTPFISRLFKVPIDTIILDGEMMVWDRDELIYRDKAGNTDVKALKESDASLRPCFVAYDILHLNGSSLTNKPYAERVRLLRTVIKEQTGFMTICQPTRLRDTAHFLECLNNAIDNREEGVVIKHSDSHYVPGERNSGWYKIKPDYIFGLVSDFDMIILGGWLNRRKTFLSKFLIGVFARIGASDEGKFYATTSIGSGLTRAEWLDLNEKLKPYWNECRTVREGRHTITVNPQNIELGSCAPDVWIEPNHSIIVEVLASELVQTTTFATKYTLRFPRIQSIRTDKMWYDCCTLQEFNNLCVDNTKVQKLTKRHVTDNDITATTSVPRKRWRSQKTKPTPTSMPLPASSINSQLTSSEIVKLDNICDGLQFCLLSTTSKINGPTQEEMIAMIKRHGGEIVMNPSSKTFLCIAENAATLRVKKLIETKSYNIATINWLVNALGGDAVRSQLLEFHPRDMLYCTEQLQVDFRRRFDIYTDSYTERVNVTELQAILAGIDETILPEYTRSEFHEMEKALSHPNKPDNIYRLATGYFSMDDPGVDRHKMNLVKLIFQSKGGRCIDSLNDVIGGITQLSHIFVDPRAFNADQFKELHPFLLDDDIASIRFVSMHWIIDCQREKRKINEKIYAIEGVGKFCKL